MGAKNTCRLFLLTLVFVGTFLLSAPVLEVYAAQAVSVPEIDINIGSSSDPQEVSKSLQLLLLLTVLSLAPAILIMTTAFTRVVVVLSFLRSAMGTHASPPNQILVGLALLLTFFIMAPTWSQVNKEAFQPYVAGEISQEQAVDKALGPVRSFMFKQTREKDLALFVKLADIKRPETYEDIPTYVLVPAFAISELKTAFQIGFMIYIPFIVIDMVIASSLMSMGMIMLPPMMISLPFKLLLFVLVDGWSLLIRSLVMTFQ